MSALRVRELDDQLFALLRQYAFASANVFERDGLCLLGFGRALELSLPSGLSSPGDLAAVAERLAGLSGEGAPGWEGAVGIVALPFQKDSPSRIVVPRVVVSRDPEGARAVTVGPDDGEFERLCEAALAGAAGPGGAEPSPDSFVLSSSRPHADFLARVERALDEVSTGRIAKVVLAREVVVEANRPFLQEELLERLRALYPSCASFAVDGFVGASPELLVRRSGDLAVSEPLAGTRVRAGDAAADQRTTQALISSSKERAEHSVVVDSIAACLERVSARLEAPRQPEVVQLRNVSHLRSRIEAVLAGEAGRYPSALELAGLLHPTPAVAGYPVEQAVEYLAKAEELDRGRYAGPVGWVRADGDGELYLGIRSALVAGRVARLYAGAGIVAGSEPAAELRETQLKLQAMLAAAVRP